MDARTKFSTSALQSGMSLDQAYRFLRGGYIPQPKQMLFHAACREADAPAGPLEVAFGGARGPGKSHAMLAQLALDDCQRIPGLKCLLLRKVGKAGKESFEDLRIPILRLTEHKYNRTTGTTYFPNESRIILGHFKDDKDIDGYLGLEYDIVAVEEATTLSLTKYKAIRSCNRTSKADWRPRTYSNANPGGIGHAWYKQRFIQPFRVGRETETRFFPATYRDNAFLNPDYESFLNDLSGWMLRAWRDGDWDIAAGLYFTNFSLGTHVIKPIATDLTHKGFKFYLSLDYGWVHPTVVLLLGELGSSLYVIDEHYGIKELPSEHSQAIDSMLGKWGLQRGDVNRFFFGADAYMAKSDGRTTADTYSDLGWYSEPAVMSRAQGAQEVLRRLGNKNRPPSLYIFNNCYRLIEQLPTMQHDPHRPEDVLKIDVDSDGVGGDDFYDALRYGVLSVASHGDWSYGTLQVPR